MTKTALSLHEIASKERMQDKDLANKREMQDKEHAFTAKENRKNRRTQRISSYVNAAGRVIGGVFKKEPQDPIWYKSYIKDLEQFTRIPTYFRLGSTYLGKGYSSQGKTPGIMVGEYMNTIGPNLGTTGKSVDAPVNQVLQRVKEQVLKLNSRSNVQWEAGDIGYNILATGNIINEICEAERILKIAQTYKGDNAYFASAFIQALGWDADAVMSNLAEFRKQLVILKTRFNSACVAPNDLSYYQRICYLASNIFSDSDKEPHQYYAYRSYNRLTLVIKQVGDTVTYDIQSNTKTALETPATFFSAVSAMITVLAETPDFVEMYADLRAAFGERLFKFSPEVDNLAEVSVIYHDSIREQIANSKTFPCFVDENSAISIPSLTSTDWTIHQNSDGYLYQGNPNSNLVLSPIGTTTKYTGFDLAVNRVYGEHVYNMHKNDVTGDDILDATRFNLVCSAKKTGSTDSDVEITCNSYGTELLLWYRMYYFNNSGILEAHYVATMVHAQDLNHSGIVVSTLSDLSAFNWAPSVLVTWCTDATPSTGNIKVRPFIDVERAFNIGNSDMIKLNEACVMSEFYIDTSEFRRY